MKKPPEIEGSPIFDELLKQISEADKQKVSDTLTKIEQITLLDFKVKKIAEFYASHLDFSLVDKDQILNEKNREKVTEWCKRDFIAGANYILDKLDLRE